MNDTSIKPRSSEMVVYSVDILVLYVKRYNIL